MKFEKPNLPDKKIETYQILKKLLADIATKTNEELKTNLLNEQAMVNPRDFWRTPENPSNPYSREEVKKDLKKVRQREREWSGVDNPQVRNYYHQKYQIDTNNQEAIIDKFLEQKNTSESGLAEMAITGILYKMLGDQYIVARASVFDDYENGVDNIIVNKQTGEIVCAFDDVKDEGQEKQIKEKMIKVNQINNRGGAQLKYGFTFINGQLIKQPQKNLPLLYLGLNKSLLNDLSEKISSDLKTNEEEIKIFKNLLEQIINQRSQLSSPTNISLDHLIAVSQKKLTTK